MSLKKYGVILTLFCFLAVLSVINTTSAAGIEALNVAVLPPVNTDNYTNTKVIDAIQAKIKRHFRYPYYETMDERKVDAALFELTLQPGQRYCNKEAMRQLSQTLTADIVVAAELVRMRSHIFQRWWDDESDLFEETQVVLVCYTYRAQDDKYDAAEISAYKCDNVGVFSSLNYIVPHLTNDLLAKIPYKTIIAEE
ncbi:MAG: hypothetical protein LBR56_05730 [Sporomusaceae bacterium]|jgi:hypothetical protein|nr:hypothetical protein [Sporomusaceae bacterium]